MKPIEGLLREHIGLDAASIGSGVIERTVRYRMRRLGLRSLHDYERRLWTSRTEWDELVEAVVVTETWFFRGQEQFRAFGKLVQKGWPQKPSGAGAPLRVLSVPCSSGEEPYSLAMTLLDAGWSAKQFVIDAADISIRALTRAQHGVYGRNSFRGKSLGFRDRYFQRTPEGYRLQPAVRVGVRFFHDNVLGGDFLAGQTLYDFVFCRNLLIYFDGATQTRVLETMQRMLSPTGFLFVGPAELPLALKHGFVSARLPMAFACRKGAAAPTRQAAETPSALAPAPAPPAPGSADALQGASERNPQPVSPPFAHPADLDTARQLAVAGKFQEAAEICEAHLRAHGPTARAFYLLGLTRDAGGDPQAVEFYRKALYLEPNHYETLVQMALLSEKNGRAAQARAFKRRAERARANA